MNPFLLFLSSACLAPSRITVAVVVLLLSFGLMAPAAADQLEDGVAAWRRADYETTFRLMGPLADQGQAVAQFYIGLMHVYGDGTPQDYDTAAKWFRKAADQGTIDAINHLGYLYEMGQGVPQDYAAAAAWYRKTANQADHVGQTSLGHLYKQGQGVEQDDVQALMWFTLSADYGDDFAPKYRDEMAAEMTPAQISQAQKKAADWTPTN